MSSPTETDLSPQEQTKQILHELRFHAHRRGYKQLCIGIPHYRENDIQSLSKDLYPWLATQFDHVTPQAVEHAIREAIGCAWRHRDPEVWDLYFPGIVRQPSNKQFIATLAERLK